MKNKLQALKTEMELAFPQLRIIHTYAFEKKIVGERKKFERLYFNIYSAGDKNEWGEVVNYEDCYFTSSYVKDYVTLKCSKLKTKNEVIDFFSEFVEKKEVIQERLF